MSNKPRLRTKSLLNNIDHSIDAQSIKYQNLFNKSLIGEHYSIFKCRKNLMNEC